jgi:hypothetical protein
MLLHSTFDICALRPFRAGGVFVRSLAGVSLRVNALPGRSASPFSQQFKISFFSVSQLYRSLTPSQVLEWNAALSSYPRENPCGDLIYPSVSSLFYSLNTSRLSFGLEPFFLPPSSHFVIGFLGFLFLEATPFSMVLFTRFGTIPPHTILEIYAASPSYSPLSDNKVNYVSIGQFPDTTLQSFSVYNEYFARFGQPVVETYVRLAARLYTIESGLYTDWYYNSFFVSD